MKLFRHLIDINRLEDESLRNTMCIYSSWIHKIKDFLSKKGQKAIERQMLESVYNFEVVSIFTIL